MRPLVTPEAMGRADAATIEAGTPGEVLMERAGRAVARAVIEVAGGRYGRKVAVVCGKGNNGGDGFVVARFAAREGMSVRCLFVGDPDSVSGAAAHHLDLMRGAGIPLRAFDANDVTGMDVVVDALFGTGFRGVAEGAPADAIRAINASGAPVVAIDIPSGVDGTTGRADGPAVHADATVVMGAEKIGTAISSGAINAGVVSVADIGITVDDARVWLADGGDVARRLPMRPLDAHKRSLGAVALLGGSAGMSGAIVLAARAAVRAGAGYATAGVTASLDPIVSLAIPEVLTRVVGDANELGPDALDAFTDVLERADALALGPGLGRGDSQVKLVARTLTDVTLPIVIDADGLNALDKTGDSLRDRSAATVLTPHPAELGRLLDLSTGEVQADRMAAVRAAAARFGCSVVLKGYRSLVARPDGTVMVNSTGGPELATAGTGDVLTGTIACLLAMGVDEFEAAWMGAYIHGLAGTVAAERRGRGVLAGDVAEALPEALARL